MSRAHVLTALVARISGFTQGNYMQPIPIQINVHVNDVNYTKNIALVYMYVNADLANILLFVITNKLY